MPWFPLFCTIPFLIKFSPLLFVSPAFCQDRNFCCGNYSRAETNQRRKLLIIRRLWLRKLFKGGNYSRAETSRGNTVGINMTTVIFNHFEVSTFMETFAYKWPSLNDFFSFFEMQDLRASESQMRIAIVTYLSSIGVCSSVSLFSLIL